MSLISFSDPLKHGLINRNIGSKKYLNIYVSCVLDLYHV